MIKIKELRARHDLTQKELSKIVGCTQQTMSHYENNPRSMSAEVLVKLARYFNVSTDDLLGMSLEEIS